MSIALNMPLLFLVVMLVSVSKIENVKSQPITKPYVAYVTSPFDQLLHMNAIPANNDGSNDKSSNDFTVHKPKHYGEAGDVSDTVSDQCPTDPIPFKYGGKIAPTATSPPSEPILYPLYPNSKSILYLHHHEQLDAIHFHDCHDYEYDHKLFNSNPQRKQTLHHHAVPRHLHNTKQMYNFPLLFQGSTFASSPLIHDVNHDGIEDAILVDYDGLITFVGLDTTSADDDDNTGTDNNQQKRYLQEYQIPRLLVRKDWIALFLNETLKQELINADIIIRKDGEGENVEHNLHWYDTFFEYEDVLDYVYDHGHDGRSKKVEDELYPVRGYNGNILHQNLNIVQQMKLHDIDVQQRKMEKEGKEDSSLSTEKDENEASVEEGNDVHENDDDYTYNNGYYDDYYDYLHLPKQSPRHILQKEFYSDENYIYLPPHVLSSPTYFEVVNKMEAESGSENVEHKKKNINQQYSISEYIAFAVSYYIDEDEYTTTTHSASSTTRHKKYSTDEVTVNDIDTESKRGLYVASALVIFDLNNKSFKSIHLDLSSDYSAPHPTNEEFDTNNSTNHNFGVDLDTLEWKEESYNGMGAFAVASPIVVDLDGDRNMEVLIGTSMGFIHCVRVGVSDPNPTPHFTIQMKNKIEHPIVVEDVSNDGKLEIFAIDASANLVCLDYEGKTIWNRNLLRNNEKAVGTSDLVLGDVDGDGVVDVVVTVHVLSPLNQNSIVRIHAINAHGKELDGFPLDVTAIGKNNSYVYDEMSLSQLAKPRLIDLASSDGIGLHIVQPLDVFLYIIQGITGCVQEEKLPVQIASVTVENIRERDILSLIVTTISGEVHVLDFPTVQSHRLNSYPNPSTNIHGLSSSSGFFIHKKSKNWRNIIGESISVTFEILQNAKENIGTGEYWVDMRIGTSSKKLIFGKIYNEAGVYTEEIPFISKPGYYTVTARLRTTNGVVYEDHFQFSYNLNFFAEILPWILLIPCLMISISLLFGKGDQNRYESGRSGIIGKDL